MITGFRINFVLFCLDNDQQRAGPGEPVAGRRGHLRAHEAFARAAAPQMGQPSARKGQRLV